MSMHRADIHKNQARASAQVSCVQQRTFQPNALMGFHRSDVDQSRVPSSLPLHQPAISEHIATAASYHLILLHSLPSPPPPSLQPALSSSPSPSSPPAFKCMALPGQASLCRQHHSPQPLQSEGEGCGTGGTVISLCSQGGREGVMREGDKVGVSRQRPPAPPCSK